jgi:hypothetical protein
MSARRHQPEAAIQRAVFQHIRLRLAPGAFVFHCPNGGARRPIEAAILQGLGVTPGVPDIVGIKAGRAFCLELKARGGKLNDTQKTVHEALRAAGAEVATADSLDAALSQLQEWSLLRGRS